MENLYTKEEFIDIIRQNVTMSCKLPYTLGNDNIDRVITYDALPYFYRTYKYALRRTYYYIDLLSMYKNKTIGTKQIVLPKEVENIRWVYMVNYNEMRNLGYMLPVNSIGLTNTTQPFVAAINVGEYAQSVAVMQGLQDALNTFAKETVKFYFDSNSKIFEIQTSLNKNVMLEVYAHIPVENLFADPYFIKYVTGISMMDYATHLGFTDMELAGNSKIVVDRIYDRGAALVEEVKTHIAGIKPLFIINKTR